MRTETESESGETETLSRTTEWRNRLAILVGGLLLFETLTGLSIYLLPFSVSNQVMVLLHTIAGLVFLIPFCWYQLRHWRAYSRWQMSHVVLTGYFALAVTLVAIVSGLVLSYQALFATRISYAWDLVHIVATFGVLASVIPHIVVLFVRARRAAGANGKARPLVTAQRGYGLQTLGLAVVLMLLVAAGTWLYEPTAVQNELPEDYSYLYGEDRPFAPSLATTSTGGAFDAHTLGGSEACGSAGCHEEIAKEWAVSSHRWSAMDPAFQKVQSVMAEQNGPETTRYCGGCHDPISLFSGAKNVFAEDLTNLIGYQEGVSCIVCHAIKETDVQGNANYVLNQPDRYMFELASGSTAKWVSDFLIRAYPRQHVETLQHRLFKSPEFCAACHKQFIDEEINQVGWVQLQNQYDNWRKSRWYTEGDPTKTIECRECHMPLIESLDPGRGDDLDYNRTTSDGKHRSHRFLAANQFIPLALELEGAEEHVELTKKWMRGELEIPEIADKWRTGPAVPIELITPDEVVAGEQVDFRVAITNNKVGHDFPTGPLDIIQAWVEVEVTDQAGNVIFASGDRDEGHFIAPGSFIFKAEPVDQYGNLIDRHNLWEMVGVRYRRALFPGFSDNAEFAFSCPATMLPVGADTGRELATEPGREPGADRQEGFELSVPGQVTELRVSAKLMYRKFDQYLLNFLFGEDSGLTAPVTVLSETEATIPVRTRTAVTAGAGETANQ
jgi:hypothetical protein